MSPDFSNVSPETLGQIENLFSMLLGQMPIEAPEPQLYEFRTFVVATSPTEALTQVVQKIALGEKVMAAAGPSEIPSTLPDGWEAMEFGAIDVRDKSPEGMARSAAKAAALDINPDVIVRV